MMFVLAVSCISACASDSPTTPSIGGTAQVAGLWRGTATTASISGGECFASLFQSLIGSSGSVSMTLTQNGAKVTATVPGADGSSNYTYAGTAASTTLTLSSTACATCDAIGAQCPSGGALRDVKLQSSNVTATVNSNTMSGTETETYNVLVAGTTTSVGTLTINDTFSLTRQ
jgi:hypothetical protein